MSQTRTAKSREEPQETQGESRSKEKGSRESCELGRLMPSPRPGESHEGVLESHNGLSPSQEARRKTQWSLVSREKLMPSPEPRGSHEGAITSRQRLSYKSRSKEKTQLSRESREKAQVES